ncbi:proline-rich extensin-like protein EPR1 [Hibiscus syriacus]|uniref:proline-rich extensin-like protein EPR1 n=1 Tax=Hibiscus syriacus TaxID=106335 RepID=UPI0019232A88|nr:proline-rich extensin-like protein EPR1 [Hibiscus syriacus]
MGMPLILQLAKLCIIGFALIVQGSSGHNASPSPAEFSGFPPAKGVPDAVEQRRFTPSMPPQPNESDLNSPPASSQLMPAPVQNTASPPLPIEENVPPLAPSTPLVLPPYLPPPPPFTIEERAPSLAPNTPVVLPPSPPPPLVRVRTPLKSPTAPREKEPVSKSPVSLPDAPAPVAFPSRTLPRNSPDILPLPSFTPSQNSPEISPVVHQTPIAPPLSNSPQNSPAINTSRSSAFPPTDHERSSSNYKAPVPEPSAPAPVASQSRNSPQSSPPLHSSMPRALAPTPSAKQENSSNRRAPIIEPIAPAPVATPSRNSPRNHMPVHSRGPTALPPHAPIPEPPTPVKPLPGESPHSSPTVHRNVPVGNPSPLPDPDISPVSNPPSSNDGAPVMSPSDGVHKPVPPVNHSAKNGSSPAISPSTLTARRKPSNSLVPSLAPSDEGHHNSSALSPSTSFRKHQHKRNERTSPAPTSSDPISPPPLEQGLCPRPIPSFLRQEALFLLFLRHLL